MIRFKKFCSQAKVMVIGDVMLDAYLWGKVDRISPEAPVPIVAVNRKESRPGGAANVALNLKSLGAHPILCSIIGNDAQGKELLKVLKKNRISTIGILSIKSCSTTIKTRVIGNGHQMIRVDEEQQYKLDKKVELDFIKHLTNIIKREKPIAIIFEDYDKGVLSPKIIADIIKLANSRNIKITVDPKKNNFLAYQYATLFKPNLKELKDGLKIDLEKKDHQGIIKASKLLAKKMQFEKVMVTLSEDGILLTDGKRHTIAPSLVREVMDVSGAGDTVISVATLALAAGLSDEAITLLSNLAGGMVCEHIGVVPIQSKRFFEKAENIAMD
ncbi:MAG: hypothetical protein RIQ89_990 [Bacteroidota bacterium]